MKRPLIASLVLLVSALCAAPLRADVLHLHNGRTMEGEVLSTSRGKIHLKVPGGKLVIPERTVKRIEKRRSPHDEYAQRARRTDMSDPVALRDLAHWASGRGLGEQAVQLRDQAKGLELDAGVADVRGSTRGDAFYRLYRWARGARYSSEVQGWLLEQAVEREPTHARAQDALSGLRAAEARSRRRAAQRPPVRPGSEEKVEALEAKLSEQASEAEALRARLAKLEDEARAREQERDAYAKRQENLRRRHRVRRRRGLAPIGVRVVVVEDPASRPPQPVYPRRPVNLHHANTAEIQAASRRALNAPRANHAPVRLKFD